MTARPEDNALRGTTFALLGMAAVGAVVGLAVLGGVVIANADEQPFTVTAEGVSLPASETFPDGGHVNIIATAPHNDLHFEAKCIDRVDAECAALHDDAQFIGRSFIPWSAFGLTDGCVSWVQVAGIPKHFGDAGEAPICLGCTPSSSPLPETSPTGVPETTEPPATSVPSGTPSTSAPEPSVPPVSVPSGVPSPSPSPSMTRSPTSPFPSASTTSSDPTAGLTSGRSEATAPTPAPARLADTGTDIGGVIFWAALAVLGIAVGIITGRRAGLERFGSDS